MPKRDPQNLELYIKRVLKDVHPGTGINGEALDLMNNLLLSFIKKLCENASISLANAGKKTLSSREIQGAVRLVLPRELGKHAVSEGTKAIIKWKTGGKGRQEKKAGLYFPVARTETLLRACMSSCPRVGAGAPVYTAAAVEYICAEILELSGNAARDMRRVRITPRHVMFAIKNDEELSVLFKGVVIGGGVLPNMHSAFLKQK